MGNETVEATELDTGNAGAEMHVGAAPVVEAKTEQRQATDTSGASPEEITRATQLGWVPLERYRGDPSKWRDARTFIKYGEDNRMVLIGETRKLSAALSERDRTISELQRDLGEVRDFMSSTQKAITERKRESLLARKKQARTDNDFDTEILVDDELKKLDAAPVKTERREAEPPPAVKQFMADNEWYGDGPKANRALTYEYTNVAKDLAAQGLRGQQLLDDALSIIKKRYPNDFKTADPADGNNGHDHGGGTGNGSSNGAGRGSAVDSGGFSNGQQQTRSKAPTFANLPAEAQTAALDFEKKHKIPRESYAKRWFDAYGDQQ